jgi:hypothetical protein
MNATLAIEGIGVWAPGIPDWGTLAAIIRGEAMADDRLAQRPPAQRLDASARRRAPDSVRLAVEIATQAADMSGRDPASLPCVFSCAYGDSDIMDRMCATLAERPAELSPTRFHYSVHNAGAGYWTIASGCHRASTALCAGTTSFAVGLLEAAGLALTEDAPVLLAVYDTPGVGALEGVVPTRTAFGCALVLAPAGPATRRLTLSAGEAPPRPPQPACAALSELAARNAVGDALALLEVLGRGGDATVHLQLGPEQGLIVTLGDPA